MTNHTRQARQNSGGRPGIREVANRAGVALSSVSRVLSGHPDVSEVMRNRVLDAVAALGYQPDPLAQSMRTGATMTAGFVVGDISNPLLSQIALGAEIKLREAGYSTLLTNSINESSLDVRHVRLLRQRRVDGLLLSVNDESSSELHQVLEDLDVPAVLVDRQIKGFETSSVLSDHRSGMHAAIEHLVELGHRHIALVNGNPDVRPSRERAAELRRATKRHGDLSSAVRASSFTAEHGFRATQHLLSMKKPPTALIAGGNQVLIGVLTALKELGRSVPDDVSLVTCDDIPLARVLDPELSTISRNPRLMGEEAAALLLALIAGDPPRTITLPTEFRPTASCAPPS